MTTTYRNPGSETTIISTELNSVANATSTVGTNEQNNTTSRFIEGEFDVYLAAAGANTGYVSVYVIEGTTTGNLATYANLQNARWVGTVQLNGATAVRKRLFLQGIAPYWKIMVRNDSGGALASSGNIVKFIGINYTDT